MAFLAVAGGHTVPPVSVSRLASLEAAIRTSMSGCSQTNSSSSSEWSVYLPWIELPDAWS